MYHLPVMKSEIPTVIWVMNGSSFGADGFSEAISSKMPTKTGTMKATTTTITTAARTKTTAGYMSADLTWRRRASSFSSWNATRSSASSRRPGALARVDHRAVEGVEDPGL